MIDPDEFRGIVITLVRKGEIAIAKKLPNERTDKYESVFPCKG